jgi:hypothetical protein
VLHIDKGGAGNGNKRCWKIKKDMLHMEKEVLETVIGDAWK